MNLESVSYKLTYYSLFVLALATFTSVSVSALSHIFIIIPGVFFLFRFYQKRDLKITKTFWALLLVLITCWMSVLFNYSIIDHPFKNFFKAKYFLFSLLGFFAFKYSLKEFINQKRKKILINVFLWATTIATVSGLIAFKTGFNPLKMKPACHPNRACGLFGMYMTYGYGISLFLILVLGMIIYRKELKDYISTRSLLIVFIINFIGLVLNYSRGAWIGFILAAPFYFFKKFKLKFILVFLSLLVIFAGVFITSEKVRDVFTKRGGSNQLRLSLFEAAYKGFLERPIFGWGYRNFEKNSSLIKKKYKISHPGFKGHAHNNILEHFASTGVLGGVAFLAFCLIWIFESYKRDDLFARLCFPFVISFFISGMTQYTFGDGENLFFILAMFSLF